MPGLDPKRTLDVTASALGLTVTSPLLALIAAAVRLDSPGPVLFRQERIGRDGVPFTIHKFRTMRVATGGPLVTSADDNRITRVGAVLRATKLDELPQLVDVLRGAMSLVGPRPEVARYVRLWPEEARRRILSVRPGITDPACIVFRHEAQELAAVLDPERYYVDIVLPRKVRMYVHYVDTRSVVGDLRIILRTFRAILQRHETQVPGEPETTCASA